MAKYSNTKAKINEKITTNSAQAITGNVLNEVLQTMVDSLGADYQFGGLVQPGSTFTAGEQPVVFLATTPGTYTNFGGIVVADGEVALLVWSGTAWSKQTPDIATRTEVSQLGQEMEKSRDLPSLILENFNEESADLKPYANYDSLATYYSSTPRRYTNGNIAKSIRDDNNHINPMWVDYFVFKAISLDNLVISIMSYSDTQQKWVLEETISLDVDSSMLDPTLGENVYKIPYGGIINGVPFVQYFYLTLTTSDNAVGYLSEVDSPYPVSGSDDNKREIAFSVIGKILTPKQYIAPGDIVNDLNTGGTDKPLSAEQGKVLNERLENTDVIENGTSQLLVSQLVKTKYLPDKPFNSLGDYFSADRAYTNQNIAQAMLRDDYSITPMFVEYFIFKATNSPASVSIYLMSYSDTQQKWVLEETISLAVDSSMLDATLGANVYKIPYNKPISFVPFVKFFYFTLATSDNAVGYLSEADSPYPVSGSDDNKREIAFGVIGELLSVKKSNWENKKIGFLGDSITQRAEYVNAFQEKTGCVVANYGIGGTHIAATYAGDNTAFEKRVSAMADDLDAVIVFGGTNDFGHTSTAQFGAFDNYTDPDIYSFYAGCHRTFKQLYDKYRGKPIIILTPLHHGYEQDVPEYIFNADGTITAGTNPTTGKTFKEYVDAIKEVAKYYSFYVIDVYSESGMNPCLEQGGEHYYFVDGLHLTQIGGNRLAQFLVPYFETISKIFDGIQ